MPEETTLRRKSGPPKGFGMCDQDIVDACADRFRQIVGESRDMQTRRTLLQDPAIREQLLALADEARQVPGLLRRAIDQAGISYRTIWAMRPPNAHLSDEARARDEQVFNLIARRPIDGRAIRESLPDLEDGAIRSALARLLAAKRIKVKKIEFGKQETTESGGHRGHLYSVTKTKSKRVRP